jgi:hypothetical protein
VQAAALACAAVAGAAAAKQQASAVAAAPIQAPPKDGFIVARKSAATAAVKDKKAVAAAVAAAGAQHRQAPRGLRIANVACKAAAAETAAVPRADASAPLCTAKVTVPQPQTEASERPLCESADATEGQRWQVRAMLCLCGNDVPL